MIFYHGSLKKFEIGFTLKPRNEFTSNDSVKELEFFFESLKPKNCLSRSKSVFLTDDPNLIDNCGGYTDYIYTISANKEEVEFSDLSWYTEAESYLEDGDFEKAKDCANKYWKGVVNPDSNFSCGEYRIKEAIIHSLFEDNSVISLENKKEINEIIKNFKIKREM